MHLKFIRCIFTPTVSYLAHAYIWFYSPCIKRVRLVSLTANQVIHWFLLTEFSSSTTSIRMFGTTEKVSFCCHQYAFHIDRWVDESSPEVPPVSRLSPLVRHAYLVLLSSVPLSIALSEGQPCLTDEKFPAKHRAIPKRVCHPCKLHFFQMIF